MESSNGHDSRGLFTESQYRLYQESGRQPRARGELRSRQPQYLLFANYLTPPRPRAPRAPAYSLRLATWGTGTSAEPLVRPNSYTSTEYYVEFKHHTTASAIPF